jgi:hypothetical protein
MRHGAAIQSSGVGGALPALRSLQKALTRLHEDLAATCEGNMYTLEYLCSAGKQPVEQPQGKKKQSLLLEGAAADSEDEAAASEDQEGSEQEGDESASDSE